MNLFQDIPASFNVSLAFVVLLMTALAVYMGFRCIRRTSVITVVAFAVQLCVLTAGILTVINHVYVIPIFEIIVILFGIALPAAFIFMDYTGMKKRIKVANTDVPLIEKLEKNDSHTDWHYEEYIESPEEWKNEIPAGTLVKTLNLADKQIKNNVTRQVSAVQDLIGAKAYKQALDAYIILSGLLSGNALVEYNTAWLCYKNELYEEAIKYYKKALYIIGESGKKADGKEDKTEQPENIRSWIHFGYGLSLYATKKFELAVNQFELAQKEEGTLREAEMNIARCYIAVGSLTEARKHIKDALKIREDNKLHYLLARLCFEQNEEMECKYQLETIVANDKDFTEAWALLGKIYRKIGDWENTQNAYKRLIQLTPQDADAYYRLGTAQRELGKTQEALDSFLFATELMPDHSRAFYSMASIHDAEGNTDRAVECLNKSLEGNEKLEMAYNLLAEIYVSSDRIKDAIHVYEECIQQYPESYLSHYNLGISLMMMKRYEEAVRVFKRAHKLTGDDPSLYYNWASAVIGLKNYTEAARLYKEGLKLKSDDDEILFGLARVSALSGDVESTMGFLAQAFDINPNLRLRAKASHDFSAYRTLPEFMELTRLPMREERKNA